MRITPNYITELKANEIFVFGSNESGFHGAGAAKAALNWGAKMNKGVGCSGQTYAIPTKDRFINTLPVEKIKPYVDDFLELCKVSRFTYLVTEIGCGLAGYSPEDIAPLFKEAKNIQNIHLPKRFWDVLQTL